MTPSSTDSEVLCSPPSLTVLQQHVQQNKNDYKVIPVEDNNTDRRKRDTLVAKNKKDSPKLTKFKVKVVMGNLELSPGSLDYKITSAAIESEVHCGDYYYFSTVIVLLIMMDLSAVSRFMFQVKSCSFMCYACIIV